MVGEITAFLLPFFYVHRALSSRQFFQDEGDMMIVKKVLPHGRGALSLRSCSPVVSRSYCSARNPLFGSRLYVKLLLRDIYSFKSYVCLNHLLIPFAAPLLVQQQVLFQQLARQSALALALSLLYVAQSRRSRSCNTRISNPLTC